MTRCCKLQLSGHHDSRMVQLLTLLGTAGAGSQSRPHAPRHLHEQRNTSVMCSRGSNSTAGSQAFQDTMLPHSNNKVRSHLEEHLCRMQTGPRVRHAPLVKLRDTNACGE